MGGCSVARYLCVTCRKRESEVLIRLQSNLVPNYNPGVNFSTSYKALDPALSEQLIDFEVTWNAKMKQD